MQRVRAQLQRIAPYFRIALITGEAGTGKETVARILHAHSTGANGPFVVWKTASLVEKLEMAEDATLLNEAQGGTLFLEDARNIAYKQQSLMLRLLQQVGTRRQDVRIIAATGQELKPLIATGQFREDLYQHLAAVEIGLIPLRKRTEDLAGVAEMMLGRIGIRGITADAIAALEVHRWPNNVRELRQVVEYAAALAAGRIVEARHLSFLEHSAIVEPALENMERLEDVVKRHVLEVLTRCSGNKLRASEVLGISRSTLYRMLDAGTAAHDSQDASSRLLAL